MKLIRDFYKERTSFLALLKDVKEMSHLNSYIDTKQFLGFNTIRICIFNTIRTRNLSEIAGVPYEESMEFANYFSKVFLLHFHKRFTKNKINSKLSVVTLPYIEPTSFFKSLLWFVFSYMISIPILLYIVKRNDLNIIRADDVITTGIPAVLVSKLTKIPVVIYVAGSVQEIAKHKFRHSRFSFLSKSIAKFITVLEKYCIRNANCIIAVNEELVKQALSYGCKKVFLSPTFINLNIFLPNTRKNTSESTNVLFVGRIEPEKGIWNLVEAAIILKDLDIKFTVVGDGSLVSNLKKRIHKEGLEHKFEIIGAVPHNRIKEFYDNTDIFVLPSYTEGASVALLEALACEKAAIATRIGLIASTFHDRESIMIVESGDVRALAHSIALLSRNLNLRERLGKNGRLIVLDKFGNYVPQHLMIYNNILSDHKCIH